MFSRRLSAVVFFIFSATSAAAQSPVESASKVQKPMVLVSIAPQKFLIDQIAGQLVQTELLIPATASVETYEPTIQQLRRADGASVYFTVGHPQFPFEQVWLERIRRPDLNVINCSATLPLISEDPHLWVSPFNARTLVDCYEKQLATLLPSAANRAAIAAGANQLRDQITALISESDRLLLPLTGRSFIIYHPELGYLAEHYKLHQLSLEHEGKEVGTRSLMEVISQGRKLGIRTVLVQPQFSAREAEMVAGELKAKVVRIDPLAYNWLDNTQAILKALADALRYDETSYKN